MKITSYPHLVREWHPTLNAELTPDKVSHGSHKKVWWLCSKNHSYESVVSSRAGKQSNGCPYCSGRKASEDNNLLITFPKVAKEWHPTLNGELTPSKVTYGSQRKVWWLCPKDHSYDSVILSRTSNNPTGCPYCAGNKASEENNLLILFPEIAKEWHPTLNEELTPKEVTSRSSQKAWWFCPKGHNYKARIADRTDNTKPTGCSYCAGKKASEDNNLLTLHPEVAKEWHPTLNGELTPDKVTHGSKKNVWWLCPKGHSYESAVYSKTVKRGCPYCAGKRVSEDNNLLITFPKVAKEWHPTLNGELTPSKVTYGSGRKVWWLCPKGHSYDSVVSRRTGTNGTGCRYCAGFS